MVKRAFSIELDETVTVEYAHAMSLKGKLKNSRKFKCTDEECNINLTCTNWGKVIKKNDKRLYFTPSSLENLHISGCYESGAREEKQRSTYEKGSAKSTIQKNGLVMLKKISENNNKANDKEIENKLSVENFTISSNKESRNNKISKSEGSNVTSILTLIEMYYDSSFDNSKRFLKVATDKILNLEEFFTNLDTALEIEKNQLGIFYGKARVVTFEKNKDMIVIKFCNSSLPSIYTNKKTLFKSYYGKVVKKYVDTPTEINVYFRGSLDVKWHSYNKKFYKDLYFSI